MVGYGAAVAAATLGLYLGLAMGGDDQTSVSAMMLRVLNTSQCPG
jgi:hypothetical protein